MQDDNRGSHSRSAADAADEVLDRGVKSRGGDCRTMDAGAADAGDETAANGTRSIGAGALPYPLLILLLHVSSLISATRSSSE